MRWVVALIGLMASVGCGGKKSEPEWTVHRDLENAYQIEALGPPKVVRGGEGGRSRLTHEYPTGDHVLAVELTIDDLGDAVASLPEEQRQSFAGQVRDAIVASQDGTVRSSAEIDLGANIIGRRSVVDIPSRSARAEIVSAFRGTKHVYLLVVSDQSDEMIALATRIARSFRMLPEGGSSPRSGQTRENR
jgi:hypothetical protein